MNLDDLRTELEGALTWRIVEYTSLKNLLKVQGNKIPVIKTLIVMLYAHFEGFVKDSLELYVEYINSTGKELSCFINSIVVASLHKTFNSYEDKNRKCKLFKNDAPVEDYLHTFFRRKEFSDAFTTDYLRLKVKIGSDVINTKSNLAYRVLQENLYKLGLDYNFFHDRNVEIDRLLNLRNSVAHGSQKEPIDFIEYNKLEKTILKNMEELLVFVYDAAKDCIFLKR